MYAIQRTGHASPWCSREPVLARDGTIDADWTADPAEVWTTDERPDPLLVQALGADVVHWGSLPDPEPEPEREDPRRVALDALIEERAKRGDATALAAREARRGRGQGGGR